MGGKSALVAAFARRAAVWPVIGFAVLCCGCPGLQAPSEYIAGSTGARVTLADEPSVQVFAPASDLSIAAGTPLEVSWRAVARTTFSVVDVFVDRDTTPDNGNENVVFDNLGLSETSALIDTTALSAGSYRVGVRIEEVGEVVAVGYAPGTVTVNQAPRLYFISPRDNYTFDRSPQINPSFEISWTVSDPDSTVRTQIYLDPDSTPNGNELLLRTSTSQTGDSFTFDLPTAAFEPGTYRILALVSDGANSFTFYAPCTIRLRGRLAGAIDLRDLHLPTSSVHGAVFEGVNPRDNAGSFVQTIGDIDNDGFDDFLIMAQFGKPQYETNISRTGIGEAYLIYGRSQRFTGLISLNSTGVLFRGEVYAGVEEVFDPLRPSRGITSFALLTDWDLDGVRELAFGIPFTDSLGFAGPLDPPGFFRSGGVVVAAGSSLRPDLGFPGRHVFRLSEFGTLPHNTSIIPGCPEGFISPKYAVFQRGGLGGTTSYYRHIEDSPCWNPGGMALGCRFSSNDVGDQFGETIAAWSFHSLIMAAPERDPSVSVLGAPSVAGAGVVSIYFNGTYVPNFPWNVECAPPANPEYNYAGSPGNPSESIFLPHWGPYHYIVNDIRPYPAEDGTLLRGSPGYFVDPDDAPNPCVRAWASIGTVASTLRIWSSTPGARLSNVASAGDVNGDGLLDLLIGAPFAESGAGACYIVLGRDEGLIRAASLQLEELALPMHSSDPPSRRVLDGIRVVGSPGERLGQAQADAGDFNGDGLPDVIIGSPLANSRRGGAAIFFGSRDVVNLTREEIPYGQIASRGLGVVVVGEAENDLAGAMVVGAGDVDRDGNDDVLIAAPNKSVRLDLDLDGTIDVDRTNCGVVYLVYGSPRLRGTISLSLIGTEELPGAVFIGRRSGDHLGAGVGEQGDRSRGITRAGDADGDGNMDLLLGSVLASPRDRARAGEVYLIYGTGD